MRKNVIKMIKILILIQASLIYMIAAGCNGGDSSGGSNDLKPDTSLSGEPAAGSDDPLKQLEDQGKLPKTGTGDKMPVLGTPPGPGADGLSLYPPNVDHDQDNIPDTTDNCPTVFNPGQEDANHNGIGDACEH